MTTAARKTARTSKRRPAAKKKARKPVPEVTRAQAAQIEAQRQAGAYKFEPERTFAPLPGPQGPSEPVRSPETPLEEAPAHLVRMISDDAGATLDGLQRDPTGLGFLVPVAMVPSVRDHGFRVQHLRELAEELGASGTFSYFSGP